MHLMDPNLKAAVGPAASAERSLITTSRTSGATRSCHPAGPTMTRTVIDAAARRWGMDSVARASECPRRGCRGSVLADQSGAVRCTLCGRSLAVAAVPVQHCARCDATFSHLVSKRCRPCRRFP